MMRVTADRLYGDAMLVAGTSLIRRNLIWAGSPRRMVARSSRGIPKKRRLRDKLRLTGRYVIGIPRLVPLMVRPVIRSDRDTTEGLQRIRLLGYSLLGLVFLAPAPLLALFLLIGRAMDAIATRVVDGSDYGTSIEDNLACIKTAAEQRINKKRATTGPDG